MDEVWLFPNGHKAAVQAMSPFCGWQRAEGLSLGT